MSGNGSHVISLQHTRLHRCCCISAMLLWTPLTLRIVAIRQTRLLLALQVINVSHMEYTLVAQVQHLIITISAHHNCLRLGLGTFPSPVLTSEAPIPSQSPLSAGLTNLNVTLARANKEMTRTEDDCLPPVNPDKPSCSLSLLECALIVANLSLEVPAAATGCA